MIRSDSDLAMLAVILGCVFLGVAWICYVDGLKGVL